jgi:hypothetical protein
MSSDPQQNYTDYNIKRDPHKYLSNTPGGVQAFASQPPNPYFCGEGVLRHPVPKVEHFLNFLNYCG